MKKLFITIAILIPVFCISQNVKDTSMGYEMLPYFFWGSGNEVKIQGNYLTNPDNILQDSASTYIRFTKDYEFYVEEKKICTLHSVDTIYSTKEYIFFSFIAYTDSGQKMCVISITRPDKKYTSFNFILLYDDKREDVNFTTICAKKNELQIIKN